jgi:DNA-binding NarL/FixJ family response regulator
MRRTGESSDVEREEPIRVVLAEDHAKFRLGLKEMLGTDTGIEVVGEAENYGICRENEEPTSELEPLPTAHYE